MKTGIFAVFAAGFLVLTGCVTDPYRNFEAELRNIPAGVVAGMVDNCIVMKRGEERQVISISHSADGIRLMNCADAPLIYVKMNFLGSKGVNILKIELPPKEEKLNRYFYRQIDVSAAKIGEKTVQIVNLKEVSPDGKSLEVEYIIPGIYDRKTGVLDVETMEIREL